MVIWTSTHGPSIVNDSPLAMMTDRTDRLHLLLNWPLCNNEMHALYSDRIYKIDSPYKT